MKCTSFPALLIAAVVAGCSTPSSPPAPPVQTSVPADARHIVTYSAADPSPPMTAMTMTSVARTASRVRVQVVNAKGQRRPAGNAIAYSTSYCEPEKRYYFVFPETTDFAVVRRGERVLAEDYFNTRPLFTPLQVAPAATYDMGHFRLRLLTPHRVIYSKTPINIETDAAPGAKPVIAMDGAECVIPRNLPLGEYALVLSAFSSLDQPAVYFFRVQR